MDTVAAKKIIAKTKNAFWFGTDYNMNIYRGCHHGCIYCDSRSTCYHVDQFEIVKAKEDALRLIDGELKGKRQTGVIGTGSMSDPYNGEERDALLTRGALELIDKYQFGVAIATKSALISRDIDVLSQINNHSPVICMITITTFDEALTRLIEPNVSCSKARFEAVKALSDAGIFTGLLMMPLLPFINDTPENIQNIVKSAAQSGAKFIVPSFGLTLREGQRDYFYDMLDREFPGLKERYIKAFGNQYVCNSPDAKQLSGEFKRLCKAYGLLTKMEEIVAAYKVPRESSQLSFF